MAAEIASLTKTNPPGFMRLLSSAACEWFLIFLLFVDAILSYLLTKFAQYCELKTPCPACSRLDHVFRKNKPRCYWSLLCSNHKEEISSLVSCSIHSKLADVHGMCEECLVPIATQSKSGSDSCRLLVGKLWLDVERSVLQNLMLNNYVHLNSSVHRICTCCNKTWRTKSTAERLLELKQVGLGASKANVKPPLPRVPGRSRFSRRNSFKNIRDKFTGQMKNNPPGSNNVDTLSHVGYAKLKISSDSESEFPFSEDEDDDNDYRDKSSSFNNYSKPQDDFQSVRRDIANAPILGQPDLLDLSEAKSVNFSSSDALFVEGLRELNLADLILLDDVPESFEVGGGSFGMPAISALSEFLSFQTVASSSDTILRSEKTINIGGTTEREENTFETVHIESSPGTYAGSSSESNSKYLADVPAQSIDNRELSGEQAVEPFKIEKDVDSVPQLSTDVSAQSIDNKELSGEQAAEPIKHEKDVESQPQVPTNVSPQSVESIDSRELSVEQAEEPIRTEKDMEPSPRVSTSEVGLLSKDTSLRALDTHESKKDEYYSPRAPLVSHTLKRNDSSYESLDGINVSDVEGEGIVDRLKRQIEHDKSCMRSLYTELEEEQNAAAIAANQAMAMITKLQEEKAALHMEALQYLRMMEEQAEYDMEALRRADDLLAEREKELQDLEAELEFYRNNFADETRVEDIPEETASLHDHVAAHHENTVGTSGDSRSPEFLSTNGDGGSVNSLLPNLKDEKNYILQCLNKLEKKIHQSSSSTELQNGLNSNKTKDEDGDVNVEAKECNSVEPKENSASSVNSCHDKENDGYHEKHEKISENQIDKKSVNFKKEIAELRNWLEELDNDQDLIKHAYSLLQNEKDGLQLVQEIANQLQELRKIESRKSQFCEYLNF